MQYVEESLITGIPGQIKCDLQIRGNDSCSNCCREGTQCRSVSSIPKLSLASDSLVLLSPTPYSQLVEIFTDAA